MNVLPNVVFHVQECMVYSVEVIEDLDIMETEIVITLCKFEIIFPPAFFVPIQYQWMYPIKRYLRTLQSYIRNKDHPESSITEGHLADECFTSSSQGTVVKMDQKLQEECEKMTVDLKRNVEEDLQREFDQESEHLNVRVDKRIPGSSGKENPRTTSCFHEHNATGTMF